MRLMGGCVVVLQGGSALKKRVEDRRVQDGIVLLCNVCECVRRVERRE